MLYPRTAASAGYVALFACLAVAVATLVQGSLIIRRATPATVKACSDLQQQLGREKVVSNRFDFQYLASVSAYYNQLQAKRFPACVVYPTEATDVVAAVKAIRKADARFAVKAGGHNFNDGWSATDQGVQIDFRRMLKKTFDPETKIGFYEPGNRWRDNYRYFGEFGYAPVGGRLGGVGSGLALGGGLSYLSAQYGLACDSFLMLDVVLPDGSFVQATRTNEYKDLFLTLSGGGNIIGVVTGYHVQLRPVGTFTAGNIIYSAEHAERLANITRDFTVNNKDPKAAIITTVEKLFTPDLTVGLDEIVLIFLVYDGENPGDIFKEFEAVPHVIDTRRKVSYLQATTDLDIGTTSTGAYYARVVAIRPNSNKHLELLKGYKEFARKHKNSYILTTLDYQPVPQMLTQASRASGGNALDLPDESFIWINLFVNYNAGLPAAQAAKMTADFDAFVDAVPNDSGLPLFLNDAGSKQKVLQSYGRYPQLQAAKRRYDPQNYFSTHQDGPSIEV